MTVEPTHLTAVDAAFGARDLIEYCYREGWTDGLPVVPPIQPFVDEFLSFTTRDPDEVLMVQEHLDRTCTVRHAAINAVMAGCRPEYFPIVLAAIDAFESGVARTNLMQSTTGQALITIVNGPVRTRLGFNSTGNIFGPGDRPNATIGRALRLLIINALGIPRTSSTRVRRALPRNTHAASPRTKKRVRGSPSTSNTASTPPRARSRRR